MRRISSRRRDQSCAVLTGYNRLDQLRAARPDLIVEHLGELLDLLEHHSLEMPLSTRPSEPQQPHPKVPVATVGALKLLEERLA